MGLKYFLFLAAANEINNIRNVIPSARHRRKEDLVPKERNGFDEPLNEAVKQKSRINWCARIDGHPTTSWSKFQKERCNTLGSKEIGRRWISAFKNLVEIACNMWASHSLSVNNARATGALSIAIYERINGDYRKGFGKLDSAAQTLFRQSVKVS